MVLFIMQAVLILACNGGDSCCTPNNRCYIGHGDCDSDNDCKGSLTCGVDNCYGPLFDETDDCCTDGTSKYFIMVFPIMQLFNSEYVRCCPFLQFFYFISRCPQKRCLIISHLQKIFQFCSKLFNESLGLFLSLVQAVLKWAVSRTRSGPRDSLKNLEKN